MTQFGDKLIKARKNRRMTQGDLADKMQLTQASISQFEKGKRRPTPALIDQFADVLEIDKTLLLDDELDPDFEMNLLYRNLKGLSPETIRKINEIVEVYKKAEKS